jgi:hypothetical protein
MNDDVMDAKLVALVDILLSDPYEICLFDIGMS